MSAQHGGPVILKPISEVAIFLKNLIPADIPGAFALKQRFDNIASEEIIRSGVVAFRDFLYLFCDRLISDGHLYAKPPKNPAGVADYPFLYNITNLLAEIGYHSKLNESSDSLLITEIPSCSASVDENGKITKPKIPASGLVDCLRFLTLCGFSFTGIDPDAKSPVISEAQPLEVSFPGNPVLLPGLKALSIAEMELRTTRRYWNDNNLLRCDYRLIKDEETDVLDVLIDFLHPLPEKLREFALRLHQRYTNMGMTCVMTILGDVNFAYAYIKNSRRELSPRDIYTLSIWQFSYSMKFGYCLVIRAKKTDRYADVISTFPSSLQEIVTRGYGCDRKLRGEPCQHGCQGIRIPLGDSLLEISGDIETWLDNEVSCSIKK